MERRIKKTTSLFARRDCLTKHRIRIISIGDEGEGKRADERVCAWCYKVIQQGGGPVTHGICPECAEAEKEMVRYLEEIKAPPGGLR